MNELPPPFPNLPPVPQSPTPAPKPPRFGLMFFLGIVLNIVSVVLCLAVQGPVPLFLGAVIAFITVFFHRYRGVFVGYITTVGVAMLGSLIVCGALIFGHK